MSDDENYEVGYGKPPKHSQFQKGQSGNPKGRPKKDRETKLLDEMWDTAFMKMPVTVNGKKEEVFAAALVLKQQMIKAAKGDNASARIAMNVLSKFIVPLMQEHREKMLQAECSDGDKPTLSSVNIADEIARLLRAPDKD